MRSAHYSERNFYDRLAQHSKTELAMPNYTLLVDLDSTRLHSTLSGGMRPKKSHAPQFLKCSYLKVKRVSYERRSVLMKGSV